MSSRSGGSNASNDDDLRGASAFGGHWRRWRHAILGRSSSVPSAASIQSLGEFVKEMGMEDVLQVRQLIIILTIIDIYYHYHLNLLP